VQGRRRTWGIDPRPLAEEASIDPAPLYRCHVDARVLLPAPWRTADKGIPEAHAERVKIRPCPLAETPAVERRESGFFFSSRLDISGSTSRGFIVAYHPVAREADILYRNNAASARRASARYLCALNPTVFSLFLPPPRNLRYGDTSFLT